MALHKADHFAICMLCLEQNKLYRQCECNLPHPHLLTLSLSLSRAFPSTTFPSSLIIGGADPDRPYRSSLLLLPLLRLLNPFSFSKLLSTLVPIPESVNPPSFSPVLGSGSSSTKSSSSSSASASSRVGMSSSAGESRSDFGATGAWYCNCWCDDRDGNVREVSEKGVEGSVSSRFGVVMPDSCLICF